MIEYPLYIAKTAILSEDSMDDADGDTCHNYPARI